MSIPVKYFSLEEMPEVREPQSLYLISDIISGNKRMYLTDETGANYKEIDSSKWEYLLYNDWYLPAYNQVGKIVTEIHDEGLGSFTGQLMSSTTINQPIIEETFRYYDFNTSSWAVNGNKTASYKVRPVRDFESTEVYALRDVVGGGWIYDIEDLGGGDFKYYIVPDVDLETTSTFGTAGIDTFVVDADDGKQNTIDILAIDDTAPAFVYCDELNRNLIIPKEVDGARPQVPIDYINPTKAIDTLTDASIFAFFKGGFWKNITWAGISGLFIKLDQTTPQTISGGQPIQDTLTASELVATDGSKKLSSLAVASYPSLMELANLKIYINNLAYDTSTDTDTLNLKHLAGVVRNDNVISSIIAGTEALTDDSTCYVEVDMTGVPAVSHNVVGFTEGNIPIHQVTTSGGKITAVVDKRTWLGTGGSGGGGGGHVIQDDGTPMTARANLNIIGARISDDAGNDATIVNTRRNFNTYYFY